MQILYYKGKFLTILLEGRRKQRAQYLKVI